MNIEVLVVGAGLAGATAARLLAEQGRKVLVIERQSIIGGCVYDYKDKDTGITIQAHGPHIFHTDDKGIWDFVNQFTEFYPYKHKVHSYINGVTVPFPINKDSINLVFGLHLLDEDIRPFLSNQVALSKFDKPPKSFKDSLISQIGENLYNLFYKGYTTKQWGIPPEELLPVLSTRIRYYIQGDRYFTDRYQGIPLNGYASLISNMLTHKNISLSLNTDYFTLKNRVKPTFTVYTGEIDRLFDYVHGRLNYRSLKFELETLSTSKEQEVAVINYPNDFEWTRTTEYKYFLNETSNSTVIGTEYPKSEGYPYYLIPTKENIEKQILYTYEAQRLEATGKFLLIGRLAEAKYLNMDQVIGSALSLITKQSL